MAAYFAQHDAVLYLTHAVHIPPSLLEPMRAQLVFPVGQGLIGLVAQEARPLYLPDASKDPRWSKLPKNSCCSAFFVPVAGLPDREGCDVLALCSAGYDAFSPALQSIIVGVASQAVKLAQEQQGLVARVRVLEHVLHKVALNLEEAGIPVGRHERQIRQEALPDLRNLSDREWSVLRGLLANQRTASIARALCISPHTVRNHLKSIFRKMGVSSQSELIERLLGLQPTD